MTDGNHPTADGDRNARLAYVIEQVIRVRDSGAAIDDDEVIARHSDLMPELEESLKALGRVRGAQQASGHGDEEVPERIGQYHIKRAIASGGMGTVYEATQKRPRRTVAVKLMRAGIASRSALRRFEYESQLLARLRHPGIAQVFEAGTHHEGSISLPFFAMEYIPGAKHITHYATSKQMEMRGRIELFIQVCDAVHHGHQKAIVHRDLKPGNILVDSTGRVRVIDFGVARATDSDMAMTTIQTGVGQMLGTLQYMSPEQCEADPLDIDTRSDVYSLGVVLFELLTRKLPYDLSRKTLGQASQVIRETEPPNPSTLNRSLRGDPATIVLKAMEKDRERRYQSAAELRDDLRRYLTGEPILARPPSTIYRFSSFVRRNRTACAAMFVVFLTMVLATAVSTRAYYRAEAAERRATRERDEVVRQKSEADGRREEAEAMSTFVFDMLREADPLEAEDKDITVREMLDRAVQQLPGRFRPAVEATLLFVIGEAYRLRGHADRAEPHLRRAVYLRRQNQDQPLDLADALHSLAAALDAQQKTEELESVLSEARTLYQRTSSRPQVIKMDLDLGVVRWDRGEYNAAETVWRDAVTQSRRVDNPDLTAICLEFLAHAKQLSGEYETARSLVNEALELRRALGSDLLLARILTTHGAIHSDAGRYAEAEASLLEALELRERLLDPDHIDLADTLDHLAQTKLRQDHPHAALELIRRAIAIARSADSRPVMAGLYGTEGEILLELDQPRDAEKQLRRCLQRLGNSSTASPLQTAYATCLLGVALAAQDRANEAEPLIMEAVRSVENSYFDNTTYATTMRQYRTDFLARKAHGSNPEAPMPEPAADRPLGAPNLPDS